MYVCIHVVTIVSKIRSLGVCVGFRVGFIYVYIYIFRSQFACVRFRVGGI